MIVGAAGSSAPGAGFRGSDVDPPAGETGKEPGRGVSDAPAERREHRPDRIRPRRDGRCRSPARSSASGTLHPIVYFRARAITVVSTPEKMHRGHSHEHLHHQQAHAAARTAGRRRRPGNRCRWCRRARRRGARRRHRESRRYPKRCFRPTARAQATPRRADPSTIEVSGVSAAAAGVMATRPATTPEAAPSEVTCRSRSRSTSAQPSIAAAVATVVFTQASPAVASRRTGATGIEPEPAEPQQRGTEHDQRQVVRLHRLRAEALPRCRRRARARDRRRRH